MKWYRLWCLEPGFKKCLISHDVVFNEKEMVNMVKYKTSENQAIQDNSTFENAEGDVQLEVEPSIDQDSSMQGGSETTQWLDQGDSSTDDQHGVETYSLTIDQARKVIKPPERYGYADLISYAFNMAEELDETELRSFKKVVTGANKMYQVVSYSGGRNKVTIQE